MTAPLRDFTAADEENFIQDPFCDDPDEGPEYVWRWTHQNMWPDKFVNHYSTCAFRDWAYVM
jgi:hypothetical protein